MDLTVLRYINRFSVAKGVPADSTVSYSALADKLGVDESQMKRVLRNAMTKGIFAEDQGAVAHATTSRLLLKEGIATWSRYSSDSGWPIASRFNDAIDKWGHGAQEPNQTAFNLFKDTTLSMFDYHEQHQGFGADFHNVMQRFTKTAPMSHKHVKVAFEWSSLSHAKIVDDLATTRVQATDPATSIVPAHLADRISFQEHSFFDPQPVSADVYFLRMIFHDGADRYAKTILQNFLVAMRPGARILIMDYVALPFGTLGIVDERRIRMRDMQMMVMQNALERDEGEWRNCSWKLTHAWS
ncbi:putative O-methyltransferase [Cladophialophora carrionii]|uniref:Putative O-methyltransferase n=1 Tax=Cladophialophora carrionii TaxID=86049 RepID=A0A1C1CLX5_9EURO|nr:putative O-methyltransferase [Cladophialophora carrionii]